MLDEAVKPSTFIEAILMCLAWIPKKEWTEFPRPPSCSSGTSSEVGGTGVGAVNDKGAIVHVEVRTWEGVCHELSIQKCKTISNVKELLATQEGLGLEPSALRLYRGEDATALASNKGCPFTNIPYAEYELSDDMSSMADLPESAAPLRLFLELNLFAGFLRGGTCPHPGRTTHDFAAPDRSPWARHEPASLFHLLALKIHGYSAIACWVLIYFTVKGSMEHVVIGKITAYIALPISMLSGLALFRMLFFRSSAFENIMKKDGPITILVFSVEMVLTWLEAFAVPSAYFQTAWSARAPLAWAMLAGHCFVIFIYIYSLVVLWASVQRNMARRSPEESNAFENAVEMLVLVLPMLITNLLNIPVHLSVLDHCSWTWVSHHKLNALLLPYIAMPGTTLVLGRDAFWFFHPDRISTMGLHNLRDRLLVQNVPIVIYFVAVAPALLDTLFLFLPAQCVL